MKSNTDLLRFAEGFLDWGGATFRSFCGLGKRDPYCNAFVSYILHKEGYTNLYCNGRKETYCPHSIQWCYDNLASIPPYLALPMDIVYFDWELNGVPNHVGFARQTISDQVLNTIEGNTSKVNSKGKIVATGVVAIRNRNAKYIQAVFRPHYPAKFDISKPLEIDGFLGYNSIAMLQKVLGLKPDGILGKETVKALQMVAGTARDGSWGPKTSKAVQKMIKTDIDGAFGPKSVKALQTWINKAAKFPEEKSEKKSEKVEPKKETAKVTYEFPTMEEIRKASKSAIIHDILEWQDNISKDNTFHYVNYGKDKRSHTCPLCNPKTHPVGEFHGWNCIGGAFASLRHGGKLKTKCANNVVNNGEWERMLKASDKDALELAQKCIGTKDLMVIRNNRNAIKMSDLKAGDICAIFHGNTFFHVIVKQEGNQYFDSTSSRKDQVKSRNELSSTMKSQIKVAIRYTGTRDYISEGAKGAAVRKIQKIVGVEDDGIFGPVTRKAVKRWQKKNGLTQDGKVGKDTIAKMKEVLS